MKKTTKGIVLIVGMFSFFVTMPLLGIDDSTKTLNPFEFVILAISPLCAGIFWIWMIIDLFGRKVKHKMLWLLIMIFFLWVGSIIYFWAILYQQENKRLGLEG